jgi:poly(3-hydroxybutyrate) depolymerase
MKRLFISLILSACCLAQMYALEEVTVNGTKRTLISYAPANLPKQAPLIIACHGMNQDAPYLQNAAKFESVADTAGFVVVYPNGLNKAWDISGDQDTKFMEYIIDLMYQRHGINKNRVYLTGFSMGGMFTYHCANRLSDKIAAFAPVSGYPMGGPNPRASRPVPILHTHGTADSVCYYSSVASHIAAWVNFNGCDKTPVTIKPYPKSNPSSPAKRERYLNGKNGVEVSLITLADKGHWWSMDTNQAITSSEVWNFCSRYSLGDAEPDVESISPENNSFDLNASTDNTFTLQFSDSVKLQNFKAVLASESGTSIPLTVQGKEADLTCQIVLPEGTVVPDGTYTLTLTGVTSMGGTPMRTTTYTYAFGVEEVGPTLNVDTIYQSNFGATQATIGEGIPDGWKRINTKSGNEEVTEGGTANCAGVRMKYFEKGGDFDAGFYLSARDNDNCRLAYGLYDNYRLNVEKGKYAVSFNSIYWSDGAKSANASFNFYVANRVGTRTLNAPGLHPVNGVSENTAQQIKGSTAHTFDFTIKGPSIYTLNFEMAEGWNSVIVGNIVVTTQPTLADRYKGGFLRTLAQARELLSHYESGTAVEALQYTIDQYATFVSTSPTQYTQATAALQKAIAQFNASPDKVASLNKLEAIEELPQPCFNLQGQRTHLTNGITVQGNKKVLWNAAK